jgi:cytochrome c5
MQTARTFLWVLCAAFFAFAAHGPAHGEEGGKIFQEACLPCHSAKIRPLDNIRKTKEEWKDIVERMIDQGAEVPKRGKDALLDYLSSTHGPSSKTTDADKK